MMLLLPACAAHADTGKKIQVCIGCHGTDSSNDPEYPNLAGQNATYIFNQVQNFKNGSREDFTMTMMVEAISDEEIRLIADEYAKMSPQKNSAADKKLAKQGKATYENTCAACHGDQGLGDDNIARLASQKSGYLLKQLRAFKSGDRKNVTMPAIAAALSDDDMKAVAEYISTL
ncbi:MAG: cytochrome c4 [Zetaproteobacteria bacterium CG_4_9_14_3_um_filter_53_7]|nr:MAG: cytochrome c4 [Zetaproteobacteria bacterium CG_4_9_14_3_um_filter_53_7]